MTTVQQRDLGPNLGAAISQAEDQAETALIDLNDGAREYSFADVHRFSQAVARALIARGLRKGERVAILSANRAEFLFVYLGAMQAGLVPVPVNIKFPTFTVDFILQDCDARMIFCDVGWRGLGTLPISRVVFSQAASASEIAFDDFLNWGKFEPSTPDQRQPAMFLYTSGSTGIPKGVELSHASHLWVLAKRRRSPESDRLRALVAAPLYHMNALSTSHAALAQHDSVVLLPGFDPESYLDAVERYRCTSLTSVPTMFAMILKRRELLEGRDLSFVRFLRMGSAPVTETLSLELRDLFHGAAISNVYGTTEGGPIVFGPHPDGRKSPQNSLGYPHPEVSVRLDGSGEGAGTGVLEIRSPALMLGYHNRPDLTEKAFTADGYYRTGDVFRRDADGFYYFVGRADDMFSCGAENIYPSEVEKMLERHPAIQQAAVVPVPDEIKGAKPVAFVVLRQGASATEVEIKQFALANAPAYHHPRRVWFLDEFPLASTNKIDIQRLADMATKEIQSDSLRSIGEKE